MRLSNIKEQLGIPVFNLNYSTDETGARAIDSTTNQPTKWMRHWDNDNRVAVSIHEDTVKAIKENPETPDLGLQTEKREGSKGEYTSHRIVKYTPAEMTL
jgi:hypothetical protein